ncbi:hypothetical protein T484DRAFT_3446637 [Baffinella frigidus]|nr:hypothetical protein T484DRAFT_3446637 [Cryptophyta sp. CCMP2293]
MSSLSESEKEDRRAQAVAKLAKLFGRNPDSKGGSGLDAETLVLEAILDADDLEEAQRLAKKRLGALEKDRREKYKALCKEEEESIDAGAPARSAGRLPAALRAMHEGKYESAAVREDYWDQGWAHGMQVLGGGSAPCPFEDRGGKIGGAEAAALAGDLARMGFFTSAAVQWGEDVSLRRIVAGMAELKSRGWPACFVFAYQEPWVLLDRLFVSVAALLSTPDAPVSPDELAIEPSVFGWLLDPPSGDVTRAGNNGFHLPHRDFSHPETFSPDGSLRVLSIWVPLTDVDAINGCMFVLPKEFDPIHDKADDEWHLASAVPAAGRPGSLKVRFPLQGARPLPAQAGSVLGWHGNTIHWGGRCASDAAHPRASFACTFCRVEGGGEGTLEGNALLSRAGLRALTLRGRLSLVAHSLIMHKRWYPLDDSLVPPEFFAA